MAHCRLPTHTEVLSTDLRSRSAPQSAEHLAVLARVLCRRSDAPVRVSRPPILWTEAHGLLALGWGRRLFTRNGDEISKGRPERGDDIDSLRRGSRRTSALIRRGRRAATRRRKPGVVDGSRRRQQFDTFHSGTATLGQIWGARERRWRRLSLGCQDDPRGGVCSFMRCRLGWVDGGSSARAVRVS
jgi:hypothetical protein